MKNRVDVTENYAMFGALLSVDNLLRNFSIEKELVVLMQIYASVLNGCGECIRYHGKEARVLKVDPLKLSTLSEFESSPYFSEKERAALSLVRRLTLLTPDGVSDLLYSRLESLFSDSQISELVYVVGVINVFNRLMIFNHGGD